MKGRNRWVAVTTAAALLIGLLPVPAAADAVPEAAGNLPGLEERQDYSSYLADHTGAAIPVESYPVALYEYAQSGEEGTVEEIDAFEGKEDVLWWEGQGSILTWPIEVEEAGLYRIAVEYYAAPGRTGNVEFAVVVNGELPFEEAEQIVFNRLWKDETKIQQDNRENDLRPTQVCVDTWLEGDLADKDGLFNGSYTFYLESGRNEIALKLQREATYLGGITVYNPKEVGDYDAYHSENDNCAVLEPYFKKYQAEEALYKSDPSLFPIADRSSPLSEPFDPAKNRLNTIGGTNWKSAGQWISWKIEVPEEGDYVIGMRYRQDQLKGLLSYRRITIDGEVPFTELEEVGFDYDTDWQGEFLGGDTPYLFHLDEGPHEIRMEVVAGDTAQTIAVIQDAVFSMNYLYRKIIMITGVNPDIYRDYDLEKNLPTLSADFAAVAASMQAEIERLEQLTGRSNSDLALMKEVVIQLEDLAEDSESIINRLTRYKDNITALSAALITLQEKPLEIDYLVVATPDQQMPRAKANFWESLISGVQMFFASFFEDYDVIGNVSTGDEALEVWVMSGRDQAQITKTLIDSVFTPATGIAVNLSHVKGTLMEATMAGTGPDIALGVGRRQPVDLALRGALLPLDGFEGFEEASEAFQETAFIPYTLEGRVYAMPETQLFDMLFYRTDILEELELEPPDTWTEFYEVVREIERRNLDVGIPSLTTQTADANTPLPKTFGSMLLQNGLSYFNEEQTATRLDEAAATEVFTEYIELYRDYALPVYYDFANRFRSGEMPLGIAPYSTFNTLYILAPEIRGLWSMKPVFGVEQEDGSINNAVEGDGSAAIIFSKVSSPDNAYAFVEWWTGEEAQTLYAREMESILGPAARHPTANMRAFENLSWSPDEQEMLLEQWAKVQEQPVIPGFYFMARNLNNAVVETVYNNGNPLATLQKYNKIINQEITRKRQEFHLD